MKPEAPVAQLDRALPSEGKGHTFESCRVRQNRPNRPHARRPNSSKDGAVAASSLTGRIADSLQIGLNIEPKTLRFPSASTFPPKLLKIHLVT
jgi:hypothetical protein